MSELFADSILVDFERYIDQWLEILRTKNDAIVAVDRGETDERRWFVRMRGEEKDFTTIWLLLGQRTLRYETYVMPAPEENAQELYEFALRQNERITGAHFSIGIEDALFLRGELPLGVLTESELDRIIGTMYATVERFFPMLIRTGFAARFARTDAPLASER